MRRSVVIVVGIAIAYSSSLAIAQAPKLASFDSASDIQKAIAKAKTEHKGDHTNTLEPLLAIGQYVVNLEYRTGETLPTVHKGQSEYIQVVDGSATLRQGGTLNDGKGPPEMIVGTSISGGVTKVISKGDYLVIPPDTAHQFTPIQTPFIMTSVHINTK